MEESNIVRSIVLIDDDPDFLHVMERRLQTLRPLYSTASHVEIRTFMDPVEALVSLPPDGIVVVFIDYGMPDGTGLDWLPKLVRSASGPVILLTNQNEANVAAEAFRAGAADFICKADAVADENRLGRSIREAVHRFRLETRNQTLTRQLKLVNAELETKNKRLRELTETAHQFVDDVAHDFRTPLTVIQQYASLVSDGLSGPVNTSQVEYLGIITEATRELAEMIDDFLDSSKLRSRALPIYRQRHTVQELFETIKPVMKVRADPKQLVVQYEIAEGVPSFFGDLSKAERVLTNLVSNAIKVTPCGCPLRLWADVTATGNVRIGVTDVGPGLEPESVKIIFERFKQIEEPQITAAKGFGLGLCIVKQLAWLNFGNIEVKSERGKGSTFAFSLPANDLPRILSCFLENVQTREDPGALWLLRITSNGDAPDTNMLQRVLSTFSYPLDLILESPDGRGVNALGWSRDPKIWAERLRREATRFHRSVMQTEARILEITIAGPWPRDVDVPKLQAALAADSTAEICHA